MTEVLLIQPPVRDFYLTDGRTFPYGLAVLAQALRRAGFTVEILDALSPARKSPLPVPEELREAAALYGPPDRSPFALFSGFARFGESPARVAEAAARSGARLVGISSLFTAYAEEALAVAREVRARMPGAAIVLGGHHPTALPEEVLSCPEVDFVLRGEAEESLPRLAGALRAGASLEGIPGLCRRRPEGGLALSAPARVEASRIPPPALDLLPPPAGRSRGRAVVVAGRGCPMRCSYCCVNAASGAPWRLRPVGQVLAEIEEAVQRHGARFIDFEDENLAFDRDWFRGILAGIRSRPWAREIELRAMNGIFPPSLDAALIAEMAAAGFRALNLALATVDPAQLARFRRPDVSAAFDRALEAAQDCGLTAVGYLLVGAPGQAPQVSLRDLLHLAPRRTLAAVSVFYPAPGSRDWELCRRRGLLPRERGALRATALPIAESRRQTVTFLRLARLLNFAKRLCDRGLGLPAPQPRDAAHLPVGDRREAGIRLLSWFLAEARLYGLGPTGAVWEHPVDPDLARDFRDGLLACGVRGVSSTAPPAFPPGGLRPS
ncbi:MAG: radical SAM protein [Desulfobacterales bacterium]